MATGTHRVERPDTSPFDEDEGTSCAGTAAHVADDWDEDLQIDDDADFDDDFIFVLEDGSTVMIQPQASRRPTTSPLQPIDHNKISSGPMPAVGRTIDEDISQRLGAAVSEDEGSSAVLEAVRPGSDFLPPATNGHGTAPEGPPTANGEEEPAGSSFFRLLPNVAPVATASLPPVSAPPGEAAGPAADDREEGTTAASQQAGGAALPTPADDLQTHDDETRLSALPPAADEQDRAATHRATGREHETETKDAPTGGAHGSGDAAVVNAPARPPRSGTTRYTKKFEVERTPTRVVSGVVLDQLFKDSGRRGPLSGADWPEYHIGDLLGQGGMAVVYRAFSKLRSEIVALKVLPSRYADDETARQRFELEARSTAQISSDNVVRVHAVGTYCDVTYLDLELIEGPSLAQRLSQRREEEEPFDNDEVLDTGLQMARGLSAAIASNVVHRDIKPGNILCAADNVLKLSDFGIVKILGEESLTMTGIALGTPHYMSPEQGRAEETDHRSDLYSVGVLLYEMLALRVPFQGDSADAIIYQHHFAEPELLTEVNPATDAGLQAVIFKLLHKRPERRYQHADELLADLELIAAGQAPKLAVFPGGKVNTGAEEALGRKSHLRLMVSIGLVAVSLLLAIGYFLYAYHQDRQQQVAELRRSAAVLDRVAPVAPGMGDILDRLGSLIGDNDIQLQAWRRQLAKIREQEAFLGPLIEQDLLDHQSLVAIRQRLGRYRQLVGDAPLVRRWQERLATIDNEIAGLRQELALLDRESSITVVQQQAARANLVRLRQLVGEDADASRWQQTLDAAAAHVAKLRRQTAPLAGDAPLPVADLDRLAPLLANLSTLAGREDAEVIARQAGLARQRQGLQDLRGSLQRLDGDDLPSLATIAAVAQDWRRFVDRVSEEDAERKRWATRQEQARQRVQNLHGRLSSLDEEELIPVSEHERVAEDVKAYRRLVGVEDADGARWAAKLHRTRQVIATHRAILANFEGRDDLGAEEIGLLREATRQLDELGALEPAEKERYTQLGSRIEAQALVLRESLAVFDQGVMPPEAAFERLTALERLVGADDPDVQRWRPRADALLDCYTRLLVLDQTEPPPPEAATWLDEYETLVGSSDASLRRWRGKLAEIDRLKERLRACDRVSSLPTEAAKDLLRLERLVGREDVDLRRWRVKVARVNMLKRRLDGLDERFRLPFGARQAQASLSVLVGRKDPLVISAGERLDELAGPPRPVWAVDAGEDDHGRWADIELAGERQRFRFVPAGDFVMGSPRDEEGREADEDQVRVRLSQGFWMAATECRQALVEAVSGSRNYYQRGTDHPAESLSFDDVQAVLAAMRERLPGCPLRLPTEAEWEYACRAGATGPYHGTQTERHDTLDRLAVFAADGRVGHAPVGQRRANPLGLYDMHGNVWEWCADAYGPYPAESVTDPVGRQGTKRVMRGGSWGDKPLALRAANRLGVPPAVRSAYGGFRLVIDVAGRTVSGDESLLERP